MDQMADEMTLRADLKDKGRVSAAEESSAWVSGVDCAGIVLSCLFCRFYDMIHMIPDSCGIHCCPSYKQVVSTMDSASSSDDDSHIDVGCGLFSSCDDISDCVELAMEISEICYH
ncbi:myoD family inhibitor domain-containing protein 2 [Scomber scombrus]|uniref:MyoD family inhibitor domain-containing protein 2 n=1 Tax=Scomber scombrus TaxID=13677 RepID=A0AAV1NI88_SCOSC